MGRILRFHRRKAVPVRYCGIAALLERLIFANGGKILQVKQTAKTDNFTSPLAQLLLTSRDCLFLAITPSNSSNKIMVFGDLAVVWGASGQYIMLQLVRYKGSLLKFTRVITKNWHGSCYVFKKLSTLMTTLNYRMLV